MATSVQSPVHTRSAQLVKSAKELIAGTLTITHSHLQWTPASSQESQHLSIRLALVTGLQKAKGQPVLRVSTGSTAKIFRLDNVEERDAFVEVLTPLKDAAVAAAKAPALTLPSPAVQKEIFEQNPDIKELHSRLVLTDFISEAEFWQSKQAVVRAVESRAKAQGKGLSTAMLTLVSGDINSSEGVVNVSITSEIINQIFAESPAVKIAYQSTVPHVKSREEFWKEYFEYVKRKLDKRRMRATGKLTATDELLTEFEETLRKYEMDVAARKPGQRQTLMHADPTVNVAADYNDGFSGGYGTAHQPGREDSVTGKYGSRADDIMRELNHHAAVVLSGRAGTKSANGDLPCTSSGSGQDELTLQRAGRPLHERAVSGLEDLKAEKPPEYIELKINDPNKYFHRTAANSAPVKSEARPVSDAKKTPGGEARGALDARLAFAALQELMEGAAPDGAVDDEFGLPRNPAKGLIPPMLEGLRKQVLATNELLRHFWRCFPASTAAQTAKLNRVVQALESVHDQTRAMQSAATGMDRVHVSQLLKPSVRCMEVAFTRLQDEQEAKKARLS